MIQAKDKGIPSMVNNTTVEVLVIDTNDNPPVFTKPVYTAPVPENAFGGFQVWTLYIVFECNNLQEYIFARLILGSYMKDSLSRHDSFTLLG